MSTPGRRGPRRCPFGPFGEHRSAQHEGPQVTTRKPASTATTPASATAAYDGFHDGIVELLQGARQAAARNINALMTATYWEIGRRIVEAEPQGKRRAGYGDVLIKHLASDLTAQLGCGFGRRNLFQMRAFYHARPDILQTASADSSDAGVVAQQGFHARRCSNQLSRTRRGTGAAEIKDTPFTTTPLVALPSAPMELSIWLTASSLSDLSKQDATRS